MKHDFTKTMKNVYISEEPQSGRASPKARENWSIQVELTATDKMRFQTYMRHELAYYNALIEMFNPRVRTFPESITALTDQWQQIFGLVAAEAKPISHLLTEGPDAPLSPALETYRKFLVGTDSDGQRYLTERMAIVLDGAAASGNIHPQVRRNIALEMLQFYRLQAQSSQAQITGTFSEDVYRAPWKCLETVDSQKKRHLQIPRSICVVVYDKVTDASAILHPYSANFIRIPHVDITEDKKWTSFILHQEGGNIATAATPWCIELKTGPGSYQLNYMDVSNPGRNSAFREGKKKAHMG
jgi:hypothetical protein